MTKALHERVLSMVHNPKVKSEDIVKLILDYYKLLGSEKTYKSVEKKFSALTPKSARELLDKDEIHLYTIIEPFHDISFEAIKAAAKMLKVPLDEKVTIKTDDGKVIKTDTPVPVGITYLQ